MRQNLDAAHAVLRRTGVPAGWHKMQLGEFVQIVGGGTPDRAQSAYWRDGDVSWITPTDLTANASKFINRGAESISAEGLRNSNATLVPAGSIVFSTRGTVGNMAVASVPLTCNQSCEILVPKGGKVQSSFLYHLLCFGLHAFIRLSGGTTFGAITRNDISRVWFAIPDTDEQADVACILDAADTAIDHLRSALNQAIAFRHSLLQAAFRFEWTKEPMKETETGCIPQSWDAVKGKQGFSVIASGNSSVDSLKQPRRLAAVDAWFMKVDDFNLPENRRFISRTKIGFIAAENKDFRVLPIGTVVIAKRGAAILKNRVRTTAVPVALDPNLMGLQMLPGLQPEFFKYQLEWRNLARYVESSGVPQLNNKDLYPRWFLKAPDEQQQQIVQIISAAEKRQDALNKKLIALKQLKKSLMRDLLTGTVRVHHKELSAIIFP